MEEQNKKIIRRCEYCNSNYEVKPGLQNFKNLFRKPSWNEWFVLIMIILVMIGAYAYYHDVKTCRDTIKNLDTICLQYNNFLSRNNTFNPYSEFNLPKFDNITFYNTTNIKQQIDNYSGHLANIENKINSIPILPSNDKQ